MEKLANTELKVYEVLGIKYFKKFVTSLVENVCKIFIFGASKEEKKNMIHSGCFNYYMGNVKNLEKVKKFRKWLIFNAMLHIRSIYNLSPDFLEILAGDATISTIFVTSVATVINMYCIMLQRYNWVRINQAEKKIKPYYEAKKKEIREELKKEELLLSSDRYNIMELSGRKTHYDFNELLEKSSLDELRIYRDHLNECKKINEARERFMEYFNNALNKEQIYPNNEKNLVLEQAKR